jgi:hypothetical protein
MSANKRLAAGHTAARTLYRRRDGLHDGRAARLYRRVDTVGNLLINSEQLRTPV